MPTTPGNAPDESAKRLAGAILKELSPIFVKAAAQIQAVHETIFLVIDELGLDRAKFMEAQDLRRREIQERLLLDLEDVDPSTAAFVDALLTKLRNAPEEPPADRTE